MMKKINVLILLSLLYFAGCKDCEIFELDDPHFDCPELLLNIGDSCDDNNPNTNDDIVNGNCDCIGGDQSFDCPLLMLNIGDPCNDNNDATINDTVNEQCNCTGDPVDFCEGVLFASRATADDNGNINAWFFDSAIKSAGEPLMFNSIEQKTNDFLTGDVPFNTNFAAFDRNNQVYTFAYQYDLGFPNPLYYAETDVFNASFLEQEINYAAPVFLNGELYAIDVQSDPPNTNYTIYRIDQSTGAVATLIMDVLTTNSPLVNSAMSSTSNNEDLIYFASATNLLVVDPEDLSVTYVDLDESYSPDNQIVYYGLEYKQDAEEVLAIKGIINNDDKLAELVSISTDGNYILNPIFDIQNNLSAANDGEISFQFYSTTFSSCDNTYYISELTALETDPIESFLIEINLNENTLIEQVYDDLIFGLEFFEN